MGELLLSSVCERKAGLWWYSRLRLQGVVPQGNTLALDFVETLLTEVVPVSKKPIFWWTTPFAISTANHREGTKKQPPIRAGQDRPGCAHTGGGRGQGRSSPGGSSQSWCRVFVWAGVLILRANFGVDDWSHQNRPMQTSQALKKEGEKGRGGGEGRSKWILKKREINRYRSDKDNGGEQRGRRGTWRRDGQDVNNNQQRTESQGKAKISVRRPVVNNNNNITATWETTRSCGGGREWGYESPNMKGWMRRK